MEGVNIDIPCIIDKMISTTYEKEKLPLFVIGAGASPGSSLHDMIKKLDIKNNNSKSEEEKPEEEKIIKRVKKIVEEIKDKKREVSRLLYYEFFGILDSEEASKLKNKFYNEILWKEINDKNPAITHYFIAEIMRRGKKIDNKGRDYGLNEPDAYCISINFDTFLEKAFHKLNEKCLTFLEPEEIDNYFSYKINNSPKKLLYPIFKARGDALYAKCTYPSCPHSIHWIPIYGYVTNSNKNGTDSNNLKCKMCGADLEIRMVFPNLLSKEKETEKLLLKVKEYLYSKIGCVIIMGFSGNWDPLIAKYISDWVFERDLDVIYLNNNQNTLMGKLIKRKQIETILKITEEDSKEEKKYNKNELEKKLENILKVNLKNDEETKPPDWNNKKSIEDLVKYIIEGKKND